MRMETIKCPLDIFLDQEVPLYIIFDTLTMKPKVAQDVGCVLAYLAKNKNKKGSEIINNIIKANIGQENFYKLKEMYIDTYTTKLKRFFYFSKPQEIYDIIDSFNIIYELIPVLQEVAIYYERKESYNG